MSLVSIAESGIFASARSYFFSRALMVAARRLTREIPPVIGLDGMPT
jgi:hypothetical protein